MIKKIILSSFNTRASKDSDKNDDLCSGWWLEVGTANPPCINYYGPYNNQVEADAAKQDSEQESKNIYSYSRSCQPRQRTIKEQELTIQDLEGCPPTFFEALLTGPRIY